MNVDLPKPNRVLVGIAIVLSDLGHIGPEQLSLQLTILLNQLPQRRPFIRECASLAALGCHQETNDMCGGVTPAKGLNLAACDCIQMFGKFDVALRDTPSRLHE